MNDTKTEMVALRLTPELKRRIKEQAIREGRTISSYISYYIAKLTEK